MPASASRSLGSLPSRHWERVTLVCALAIGILAAALTLRPPPVRPANARGDVFSAERALEKLRVFASAPRNTGSPGHAAGIGWIESELREIGLRPERQDALSVGRFPAGDEFSGSVVHNVMARLPGKKSTGAILLSAHHDSGATGNGAADCGSCVVAVLETARALMESTRLRNDVIVLFTDAEENGDLGARAFAEEHPWMQDVRVALNFEAMGIRGATTPFWMTPRNGALVSQLARLDSPPAATSFVEPVIGAFAGLQPGCDGEEYAKKGAQVATFAFMRDAFGYHTELDHANLLDPRSLQHEGEIALAVTRALGRSDLGALEAMPDDVYFLLPGTLVRYPEAFALPFAILAALAACTAIAMALARGTFGVRRLAAGAGVALGGALVSGAIPVALWLTLRAVDPDLRAPLVQNYGADAVAVGLCVLAFALWASVQALAQKRPGHLAIAHGALGLWAVAAVVSSAVAPGASYVFVWPLLLAAAFALLGIVLPRHAERIATWGTASVAIVAMLLWWPALSYPFAPLMYRVELMMGIPATGAMAVLIALVAPLLSPGFERTMAGVQRFAPALALGLAAWLLLVLGAMRASPTDERPRPDSIAWEYDADRELAEWVSADEVLSGYTSQFLPEGTRPVEDPWTPHRRTLRAPAPRAQVALPEAEVVSDEAANGGLRRLTVRVRSARGAPDLHAAFSVEGPIRAAALGAWDLDLRGYERARRGELDLRLFAVPPEGFTLRLELDAGASALVRISDTSAGFPDLPELPLALRPRDTMPRPGTIPDATIVRRTVRLDRLTH